MADGTTNQKRHRIVTARMVVVSIVVGVVLAVASVPVGVQVGEGLAALFSDRFQRIYVVMGPHDVAYSIYETRAPGCTSSWHTRGVDPAALNDPGSVGDADPRNDRLRPLGYDWAEYHASMSAGWPLRAADGWWGQQWAARGSIGPLEWSSPSEGIAILTIGKNAVWSPYRPVWLGLIGNTMFYALAVLGLLAGARLWRTRRRRKSGRCVACGYEFGEGISVCPECGLAAHPLAGGA